MRLSILFTPNLLVNLKIETKEFPAPLKGAKELLNKKRKRLIAAWAGGMWHVVGARPLPEWAWARRNRLARRFY
ncbi:hypothetical protein [Variovorax sp. PBL-H6]|uniref:hypothetical protein n=1 Tax=Variovorax sp. PBL-H6 TaxID=434009 RepID=UPI0013A56D43|nr:hypothetical protein [Variovorax sp. PBL-H6]